MPLLSQHKLYIVFRADQTLLPKIGGSQYFCTTKPSKVDHSSDVSRS